MSPMPQHCHGLHNVEKSHAVHGPTVVDIFLDALLEMDNISSSERTLIFPQCKC